MKMKKSTDDLMKILRSTPSVDEYFDRNDSEIFFGSLSELIDFYLARKKLTKAEVVRNSGMNRGYCYEIMAGKTTKNISRDKVIMLCFGLNLTVDEADSIIIFSLEHHIGIVNTNIKLGEYSLEILE